MADGALDTLEIRTPDGVTFSLPLAGVARRFLAWGVDVAASFVLIGVVNFAANTFGFISPDLDMGFFLISVFLIYFGYAIVLEWFWRGRTLGKYLLGIRVMDAEGLYLQFSQVALRNLIRLLDALPSLYLVGGIAMLVSGRSQRLGDLAANTVVTVSRRPAQPDLRQLEPERYNSFREYPHLEARLRQRAAPEERRLLVQALLRRDTLEPEARVRLYAEIVERLKKKAPFPESVTAGLTDEQYLRNTVESLYRKSTGGVVSA